MGMRAIKVGVVNGIMIQHVYWAAEETRHTLTVNGDCWCEPEINLVCSGAYVKGRIFVHQLLGNRKFKRARAGDNMT